MDNLLKGFLTTKKQEEKGKRQSKPPLCIECKKEYANYWGKNFCEACMVKILKG